MELSLHKRVFFCVLCLLFVLSGCGSRRMEEYYSEKTNYISITGTVSHIMYNQDHSVLYLAFDLMSTQLSDNNFKIVGKNLQIVQNNDIDEILQLGDQVTFTTASKYFGDGYVMPIVEISIEGKTLLEFDDGYKNFISWLQE